MNAVYSKLNQHFILYGSQAVINEIYLCVYSAIQYAKHPQKCAEYIVCTRTVYQTNRHLNTWFKKNLFHFVFL